MTKKIFISLIALIILVGGYLVYSYGKLSPGLGKTYNGPVGDTLIITVPNDENELVEVDISNWKTYRNEEFKFQFSLPNYYDLKPKVDQFFFIMEFELHDERTNEEVYIENAFQGIRGVAIKQEGKSGSQTIEDFEGGYDESAELFIVNKPNGENIEIWRSTKLGRLLVTFFESKDVAILISTNSTQSMEEFAAIFSTLEFIN